MLKMWRSPIFEKKIFPAENVGNMPEKPVFGLFLENLSLVFSDFLHNRCVLIMAKIWPSPIYYKNFFPAENARNIPEIAVFADFVRTFSLNFVVFSLKNITNNNAHH